MAKIATRKLRLGLDPQYQYKETPVDICYDATDRHTETFSRKVPTERFYIKLPPIVAEGLGVAEVRANDQDTVLKLFMDEIEHFKNISKETRKIIIYRIKVNPPPQGAEKSYNFHEAGLVVDVWAAAYTETVAIAGDGKRRYAYELIKDSPVNFPGTTTDSMRPISRAFHGQRVESQVPYTEENEQFWIWIKERLNELVVALGEIISPEKLLETINEGRLLPLGRAESHG